MPFKINRPKNIDYILKQDVEVLKLRISTITNKNLLDSFYKNFTFLHDYKPKNAIEKADIMAFSKVYIDEFKFRLNSMSVSGLREFLFLMQERMTNAKSISTDDTFMTLNLVRLYSYGTKLLEKKGYDKKELKKEFL